MTQEDTFRPDVSRLSPKVLADLLNRKIIALLERKDRFGSWARDEEAKFQKQAIALFYPANPKSPITPAAYLKYVGPQGLRAFAFVEELMGCISMVKALPKGAARNDYRERAQQVIDVLQKWLGGEEGKSGNSIEEIIRASHAENEYAQKKEEHLRSGGGRFNSAARRKAIAAKYGIAPNQLAEALQIGRALRRRLNLKANHRIVAELETRLLCGATQSSQSGKKKRFPDRRRE